MAMMTQAIDTSYLKCAIVSGTTANTNITVAAGDGTTMVYGDVLVSVIEMAVTTNAWTDRTSTSSITSSNYLQCSVDTSNDKLLVIWEKSTGGVGYSRWRIGSGIDSSVSAGDDDFDISGITTDDHIIMAVGVDGTSGLMTDFTSGATCDADGVVSFNAVSPGAMNDDVLVLYYDLSHDPTNQAQRCHTYQSAVSAGANANTNITVTGITTSDRLVSVIELHGTNYNIVADRTSTCSITSAGYIQCTASTSTGVLWVLWDKTSI